MCILHRKRDVSPFHRVKTETTVPQYHFVFILYHSSIRLSVHYCYMVAGPHGRESACLVSATLERRICASDLAGSAWRRPRRSCSNWRHGAVRRAIGRKLETYWDTIWSRTGESLPAGGCRLVSRRSAGVGSVSHHSLWSVRDRTYGNSRCGGGLCSSPLQRRRVAPYSLFASQHGHP